MENETSVAAGDSAINSIAENNRSHWLVPALIFGGLEFAIPVMMAGATLVASFSFKIVFIVVLIAMALQWFINALQGYMGAKLGLPCSVIARRSLGIVQSRIVLGAAIAFMTIGWGALQIEVAGDALCALVNVSCTKGSFASMLAISLAGIGFALPAIGGFTSMKWVDVVAVPAGILLVATALWLSFSQYGIDNILAWSPQPKLTILQAISLVVGLNVAQWLIASDYTRHSRPKVHDQILIPLGILSVGIPLLMVGALMAFGSDEANIVVVMQQLNFPVWGYAILLLALGTSLLVNSYTMGLAIANTFNAHGNKGRMITTLMGTVVCILAAISGVVEHFTNYLFLVGIIIPPIVGAMFADFYLLKRQSLDEEIQAIWNPAAFVAIFAGAGFGYYTQYVNGFGVPALQSLMVAIAIYVFLMRFSAFNQAGVTELN